MFRLFYAGTYLTRKKDCIMEGALPLRKTLSHDLPDLRRGASHPPSSHWRMIGSIGMSPYPWGIHSKEIHSHIYRNYKYGENPQLHPLPKVI